ncbi:hypothetical protein LOTGIDRAFT_238605 [Lottia gigantea]|uniref:Nuclear protein MDM1 n=1 Tax=Lottia gigantea TaxID=225164 RepID=V4ASR9_LOTGI|nr:hypothetical protein LOTGIDRAFT_238605 [Lottia gigantea]ESP00323.1 hypothetical protein LOTGIDRAFT_238605 [Lottia gigantea]
MMPVRFKGKSEYDTHYKWVESYRGKNFKPSLEQAAPQAGGTSEYKEQYKPFDNMLVEMNGKTHNTALDIPQQKGMEPSIQQKKRVEGPTTSMSCDFFQRPPPEEYIVLGGQDKFSTNNVKYVPKKRLVMDNVNRSEANSHFIQPQPDEPIRSMDFHLKKDKEIQVETLKPAKSPPKVNTRQFTDPLTPLAPREPKYPTETHATQTLNQEPQLQHKQKSHLNKNGLEKSSSHHDTHHAHQQNQERQNIPKTHKTKMAARKNPEEIRYKAGLKDKNIQDVLENKKFPNKMNEFTQANIKKGILDSAPEATADYSLQYKAGVAPLRKGRKWSEYQKEFDWKNRVESSPLIAADQVVHKSNTVLVAPKQIPKPRASEYKSQFKAWKVKPVPVGRKDVNEEPEIKKAKIKRNKSMGAIDRKVQVDKENIEAGEVIKSTHGKLRKRESEYDANFKAPQEFQYMNGAWHGANPPQLYTSIKPVRQVCCSVKLWSKFAVRPKPVKKSKEKKALVEAEDIQPEQTNWYTEVLELRQKADEYRKRGQGSHFSRAHLAQLLARQTELWDCETCSTTEASTISALSLETGSSPAGLAERPPQRPPRLELNEKNLERKSRIQDRKLKKFSDLDSTKATIAETPAPSVNGGNERRTYKPRYTQDSRGRTRQVKTAWQYDEPEEIYNGDSAEVDEEVETPVDEDYSNNNYRRGGRLPTPHLQKQDRPVSRHHFDLTTPSVGGALLSSPPSVRSLPAKTRLSRTQPIPPYDQDLNEDDEEEARMIGKTYNLIKNTPKPTYGLPSRDTHYLLDEEASTDRPMRTQFLQTEVFDDGDTESTVTEGEIQTTQPKIVDEPRYKRQSPSAPAMDPIYENFGQTYNKAYVPPIYSYNDVENYYRDDDDNESVLSLSVRSIASSCSYASEILERSKDRRDNFWNNNTRVPTK